MRKCSVFYGTLLALVLVSLGVKADNNGNENVGHSGKTSEYTVAAYIWPSCHDDPMGREVLWPEKTGYELDNDPKVMERWIEAATDHGVNTFIFDWYWFNNGPFLEGCLNDGFLKAKNNQKMNFYIMWADHDVARNYWNVHRYKEDNSRL